MSAKEVAEVGFKGMMKGKLHVIPGFKNRILAFFSSITPSSKLRLNMAAKVMASK
jgi:short-subunit dehydrogenase